MSFNTSIFTLLQSDAAITGVVNTKVFTQFIPQTTPTPCIVYNIISQIPNNTHGANGKSTLDMCRVQFSMIGPTQTIIDDIGSKLRNLLDYYCIVPTLIGDVTISNIQFDSETNYFDNESLINGAYVKTQDYFFALNR